MDMLEKVAAAIAGTRVPGDPKACALGLEGADTMRGVVAWCFKGGALRCEVGELFQAMARAAIEAHEEALNEKGLEIVSRKPTKKKKGTGVKGSERPRTKV